MFSKWNAVAAACLVPAIAHAGDFSRPIRFARDNGATYLASSVAADANGDISLALLTSVLDRHRVLTQSISTATRQAGEKWGPLGAVFNNQANDFAASPVMLSSAAGTATVVWETETSGGGTSTLSAADRPPGGTWTTQTALTFTSVDNYVDYKFVMNEAGDAAILLIVPVAGTHTTLGINAIRRPAGSTVWGPLENVATINAGTGADLLDAAIDPQGDVSVAWHGYELICTHRCHEHVHTLHVAQAVAGSAVWQNTGALKGISTQNYIYSATLTKDSLGRTGVAFPTPSGISVVCQHGPNALWSRPVNAVPTPSYPAVAGFVTAPNGASDLVFAVYNEDADTVEIDHSYGSIATNSWAPATNLVPAINQQAGVLSDQFMIASSETGRGLFAWTMNDGTVQAITAPSPQRGWGSPMTIVQGNGSTTNCEGTGCTVLQGVNVGATGHAAISYQVAKLHGNYGEYEIYAASK